MSFLNFDLTSHSNGFDRLTTSARPNPSNFSGVNAALSSRSARPDPSNFSGVNAALSSRSARPELVEGFERFRKRSIKLLFLSLKIACHLLVRQQQLKLQLNLYHHPTPIKNLYIVHGQISLI